MKYRVQLLIFAAFLVLPVCAQAAELDTQSVRKGVVRIMALGADGNAELGSGFVINSSGNVVTNAHVIKPVLQGGTLKILTDDLAEELKPEVSRQFAERIKSAGGIVNDQIEGEIIGYLVDKLPEAHVRWYDEKLDLAVLDCDASGLKPLSLTTSANVKEGEPAYALGFPGKGDRVGPTAFLSLKVYDGTIASKVESGANGESVYQTTVAFAPGNSGGPLMTECGTVIGITSFHLNDVDSGLEALRYAIRIDELVDAIKKQNVAVPFTLESGCVASGGSGAILGFGVVLAVMLGAVAVVLAATNRGRRAVKDAIEKSVRLGRPLGAQAAHAAQIGRVSSVVAVIKGLAGPLTGKAVPVDGTPLVMGRDPDSCQIVFPPSTSDVSKNHCVLRRDPSSGWILLEDLNSKNGTFVLSGGGSERVLPGRPRALNFGERFSLGGLEHVFELQPPGAQNQAVVGFPPATPLKSVVPVLKGLHGEFGGRTVPVDQQGLIVGRDATACHLVLPDHFTDVSKRHCSVKYDSATRQFILEDLGSTNGTFVFSGEKQERLAAGSPRRLQSGERFFLGDIRVLFAVDLESI